MSLLSPVFFSLLLVSGGGGFILCFPPHCDDDSVFAGPLHDLQQPASKQAALILRWWTR